MGRKKKEVTVVVEEVKEPKQKRHRRTKSEMAAARAEQKMQVLEKNDLGSIYVVHFNYSCGDKSNVYVKLFSTEEKALEFFLNQVNIMQTTKDAHFKVIKYKEGSREFFTYDKVNSTTNFCKMWIEKKDIL